MYNAFASHKSLAAQVVSGWANYLELALTQNGTIIDNDNINNELRMECTQGHYSSEDCTINIARLIRSMKQLVCSAL